MTLLGVTITPPSFFYVDQGTLQYTAPASPGVGTLHATARSLTFSSDSATTYPVIISPTDPTDGVTINVLVNSSNGNLSNGGVGSTLTIKGGIDLDRNGIIDGDDPSGTLLTAQVSTFGFRDTGTTTDSFDLRATPTSGILAGQFGQLVGVTLTSEHSTFVNTFASNFTGDAKGNVGAIKRLVGDTVWLDSDGDGVQDGGELGVNGVTVNLRSGAGALLASTTTAHDPISDTDGNYAFDNLTTGSYQIEVVRPLGYFFSPQLIGGNAAVDSNVSRVNGIAPLTLTTSSPSSDFSVDAGLIPLPTWLAPSSQVVWDPSTKNLTLVGGATIVADPATDQPTIDADGATSVLTVNPVSDLAIHVNAIHLSNGATAAVTSLGNARTASNHRVLRIAGGGTGLTIDATSALDLADNDIVLDYSGASPEAGIEALVAKGYNFGNWLGKGIWSSVAGILENQCTYALGVATNGSLVNPFGNGTTGPLFAGQSVDNTTVLIKFTHRVDLDLDGLVTGNDASVFNNNYDEGNGIATWQTGDMDYDGVWTSNDAAFFNCCYDESLPQL
jgi:hypothetical protein